jgi:hypothetical protein
MVHMTTTHTAPVVLASVIDGDIAVQDGMVYRLTVCCKASGKGSANSPTGVCCRNCYRPVDSKFGWGAWVTDPSGPRDLADQLRPVLEQFADSMAQRMFEKAVG